MSSRLDYLLERYITRTCTDSERQELARLVLDPSYEDEIRHRLEDLYNNMEASADLSEQRSESILQSILQPAQTYPFEQAESKERTRYPFSWKLTSIAASVILIISSGAYYLLRNGNGHHEDSAKASQDVKAPEANKAMIVMENGKTVLLDSMQKQTLALQGNVKVEKTEDGRIIYQGNADETVYNTLINPKGSKVVSLTLQDGSKVWLNCESSLKYPISFKDKDRIVEIRGEAYFEVAKNPSKKFMVVANGVKTVVLGTHFNVNAYNDLGHVNVTLLEGSVRVSNTLSNEILLPGQEAHLNEMSTINIDKDVETDEIIAWKDGLFNFNNLPLSSIMKQIERWYDVDVVYEGKNSEKHFSGIFSRNDNVSGILKTMELAGVKFSIEGKKITVKE